jgi:hypothetical protein
MKEENHLPTVVSFYIRCVSMKFIRVCYRLISFSYVTELTNNETESN